MRLLRASSILEIVPRFSLAAALLGSGCTDSGVVLEPPGEGPQKPGRVDVVAAGPYHTCAIRSGSLFCWGANADGELGVGDQNDRSVATAVNGTDWSEVVVGESHTCARRTAGSVWCWGNGISGQLGTGDPGPELEPAFVSLPSPAAQLASKYSHTCAIDESGALFCWGANEEGQLAQNDPFPGEGVDRFTPVRVGSDNDWILVDTGQGHTCGLRSPGDLWCWGRNSDGELGNGSSTDPGQIRIPLRAGNDHDYTDVRIGQSTSLGIRHGGELYSWGENLQGGGALPLSGLQPTPTKVGSFDDWASISVDTFHGCGIRVGQLYCWGRNGEGQLGLGDNDDRIGPTPVDGASDWAGVAAGRFHTCAQKKDGSVRCTGQNGNGQLGLGDFDDRNVFTDIVPPP